MRYLYLIPFTGSYSIDLVNDSLYEWQVNILKVDNESPLHGDLNKLKVLKGNDASIMIGMSFRDNYPFEPPFVRVISPVLQGGLVFVSEIQISLSTN